MNDNALLSLNAHYIDGSWISNNDNKDFIAINPASEAAFATLSLGSHTEVDQAVLAARRAFPAWSATSVSERITLLEAIIAGYKSRMDELALAISTEMGAPISFARKAQAPAGLAHLKEALRVLKSFDFEQSLEPTQLRYEAIGVCGLITPWNWPLNQITCKVGPALAAGCTMVLKPSEMSPWSARIFAEILDDAGLPSGVFNMVQGSGEEVGAAIAAHPQVDMVSFTGSVGAGQRVAQLAAPGIKRVTQELGGKSPWIILPDANLDLAVKQAVRSCFANSGQSCNAPTRLLVPADLYPQVCELALSIANKIVVGPPESDASQMGPIANANQYEKVKTYIQQAVAQGGRILCGGIDRPAGLDSGYYIPPTLIADVTADMTIACEEVFGPVLSILCYQNQQEAIAIANDSDYGLAAYVSGEDRQNLHQVARQLRAGMVHINGAASDIRAPFGGYKQSGNGREWGVKGFEDYLEVKSIFGFYDQAN